MEESIEIATSPTTMKGEEPEEITREAIRDLSDQEWFISIFGQQPDPKARSKHQIPKAPAKFREYEKGKNYFDPWVVSLGPYHTDNDDLKPMEKHKIMAVKQIVVDESRGRIFYEKFKELTGVLKEFYDAEVMAKMSDDDFARMMFLDGCFVLYFIIYIIQESIESEISNHLIPLIIRDMFLMENQLPFKVLDELMNFRWGISSLVKQNIVEFIKLKVLMPMGFYSLNYSQWFDCYALDILEDVNPLHLLDVLRTILLDSPTSAEMHSYRPRNFGSVMELRETGTILLDFPPSNGAEKKSYRLRNFGSVMELKEIGIRFENRRMKSLMDISFKENLLFPRLLLPTMVINDTTISQLLNLTALEACSDTYSGCGVTSYIHFMDSLINDDADVKMLRSKGILHHSLGSDDEVTRLFNKWPAIVRKDLQLYSDISMQILRHRDRRVNISIAKWLDKYFGSPWTAISFVAAVLLLVFTAIQTYFAAFSGR